MSDNPRGVTTSTSPPNRPSNAQATSPPSRPSLGQFLRDAIRLRSPAASARSAQSVDASRRAQQQQNTSIRVTTR